MRIVGPRGGRGYITKKGYRRIWYEGRLRMEHCIVWENANGPIPEGYLVHHVDDNKLNNRLENLALVDHLTHKRIHSGCLLIDGEWYKLCGGECRTRKNVSEFYERTVGIAHECKRCSIKRSARDRQKRRSVG